MIRLTVLYPNKAGARFDLSYYYSKHIPMVRQLLEPALKSITVEEGLAGMPPGTPVAYSVLAHLSFESVDTFQAAFTPHAGQILGDIPNYTDLQPTVQLSNVKI